MRETIDITLRELKKRGIPEEKQKFYLDDNDLTGNLQLLEGLPNQEKLNKDFVGWLEGMYQNIDQRKEFMKKHYIPQDIDLSFKNFEEFFHKPNNLILEELRKVLSV